MSWIAGTVRHFQIRIVWKVYLAGSMDNAKLCTLRLLGQVQFGYAITPQVELQPVSQLVGLSHGFLVQYLSALLMNDLMTLCTAAAWVEKDVLDTVF